MRGAPRAPRSLTAQAAARSGAGPLSSSCSSAATRYCSVAHAPRSTVLQRSEQNGRNSLSGRQGTCFPHRGQGT